MNEDVKPGFVNKWYKLPFATYLVLTSENDSSGDKLSSSP